MPAPSPAWTCPRDQIGSPGTRNLPKKERKKQKCEESSHLPQGRRPCKAKNAKKILFERLTTIVNRSIFLQKKPTIKVGVFLTKETFFV
jgi:hypothetical protein